MTSEGDEVQAKADAAVPEATDNIEKRINAQTGGGQALDEVTQTFFESGLGYDFSQVRVHTDAEANSLSRELSAEAFTTGNDIFFREGAYQPNTDEGKKLVAHELTHVVQQNAIPAIQRALSDVLDSDRIDIDYLIELDAFEDALNSLRDAIGALDMPELSNEKCSSNPLRYSASQSQQGITWYDTTEGGWDQRTNTMTGIYIELGPQAFKSTEFLYNTMMHEYQHMLQFIRNPNEWMVANRHGLWEFEAYYWEITHLSETEITDAAEIADMGRRLTTEGWNRMNQQEKTDHQAEYDNAINIIRGILGDPAWTP